MCATSQPANALRVQHWRMPKPRNIFVQIPSYRDPQLIPTLMDLAQQAQAPGDIRVVVCWQHDSDDALAAFTDMGFRLSRSTMAEGRNVHFLEFNDVEVELVDIPYLQAKGAGWARSVAQSRFGGERYNLQIDAHHRFVQRWDTQMVEMLESVRCRSQMPLLTGYPPAFCPASYPGERQEQASVMLVRNFTAMGIVSFRAVMLPADGRFKAPIRARFMSGGFVFSDGSFVDNIRQDPDHFFLTEEIVMAARAYTHGYDFFHPHVPLLWHDYESSAPEVWDDLSDELKREGVISASADDLAYASSGRARRLLEDVLSEGAPTSTRYGLGVVRSLDHYERFAGLSFSRRAVHRSAMDMSEPDDAHVQLSEDQWERDLICKRLLHIRVSLSVPPYFEVDSIQIAMKCSSGHESVIRELTPIEVSSLIEKSAVELVHTVASAPGGLPVELLLRAKTNHSSAGQLFTITAVERHV